MQYKTRFSGFIRLAVVIPARDRGSERARPVGWKCRASRASRVALRAPGEERSGAKRGFASGPAAPIPPGPPTRASRAQPPAAPTKLCPLLRADTSPGTYKTRARARLSGRGGAILPIWEDTSPRRCPRPAHLKGAPRCFLDAGFPSYSGKPGKHLDLFVFSIIFPTALMQCRDESKSNARIGVSSQPFVCY